MMPLARVGLAFALALSTLSGRTVGCQQLRRLEVGIHTSDRGQLSTSRPSVFSLNAESVERSVLWSMLAGAAGLAVDQAYCERHHANEPAILFGPCFLYASEGFAAGWFGGTIVGSSLGAARISQKRGCPRLAAILRSAAGAAIGALPGLSIVAGRSGNYPPSRSVIIAITPLLGGIGAAAAVTGCHGS